VAGLEADHAGDEVLAALPWEAADPAVFADA
jgi:hypothetical protein